MLSAIFSDPQPELATILEFFVYLGTGLRCGWLFRLVERCDECF